MIEVHHIYGFLMAASALAALVLGSLAFSYRRVTSAAEPFAAMMLGEVVWSGSMALVWWLPTLQEQLFWRGVADIGSVILAAGFLGFALALAGRAKWRTPRRLLLVFLPPAALAVIGMLNPGGLYYAGFLGHVVGPDTFYTGQPGPLYWALLAVLYAYVAVGLFVIMRVSLHSVGVRRTQAAILLVGWAFPVATSVAFQFGIRPLGIFDATPVAFIITAAVWFVALLRGRLLNIVPLARNEIVQQMDEGFIVVDAEDRIVDTNLAAERLAHVTAKQVRGKEAAAILGNFQGAVATLHSHGDACSVLAPVSVDGDLRHISLEVRSLGVGLGDSEAHLVTLHDVTDLKRSEQRLQELNDELQSKLREIGVLKERLQEQAIRDPLTTLYNRRFLDESLVLEIAQAQRSTTPIAFLMLDIDHFKQVNDTYSHAAGDAALRTVSQVLLAGARAGDTVARYGGEEFVVVMPDSCRADALRRAEEFRRRIAETVVRFDSTEFSLTVSIGVAEFPSDGPTADDAIAAADRAMYRGKESGRNKTVAADSGPRGEPLAAPSPLLG
jgi:diguanylate cyclase (GGDEF)-like protein/PAS domain S-box-containing protein